MKTISHITIFLLFGAILFQSCSKISDPYYTVKSVSVDTNNRAVLLEDYTGHLCVNCAPAAKIANTIQALNDGQVFVIAVHAGSFAKPDPIHHVPYLSADYRSPAGNDWNDYSGFNIDGYPKGMVNRRPFNGKPSFGTTDWNQAIQTAVELPKMAVMTVNNTYNSQTKLLNTKVDVKFLLSYTGKVNLTVCILEDSIYGGQLNNVPGDSMPIIKNFRFMHVLRGSLNGSFGEEIATNPASTALITKSYSFDFADKSWVPAHCSVIAFISDSETDEVLHVAKSKEL
jgi:hypothetical protein